MSDRDDEQKHPKQMKAVQQPHELDRRYGKIGISAVAGAVRHQREQRTVTERRFAPYDRD